MGTDAPIQNEPSLFVVERISAKKKLDLARQAAELGSSHISPV
jgi:hypothetical protein